MTDMGRLIKVVESSFVMAGLHGPHGLCHGSTKSLTLPLWV